MEGSEIKNQVPEYPVSLEGWVKHLKKHFDVPMIKAMRALSQSGFLEQACEITLNDREKIPFEVFWEGYGYKVGSKVRTAKLWNQLSYGKQKMIINEAVPRYKRYIAVSGVAHAHASTWLSKHRYNDQIPSAEEIKKFHVAVEGYFHKVIDYKSIYRDYHADEESTVFRAAEAFMFRYPNATSLEVCGVLDWMVKTYDAQYRHLVKPVRAMSIQQWPKYRLLAESFIEKLKTKRAQYLITKAMQDEMKPIPVQELPFEGNTEEE